MRLNTFLTRRPSVSGTSVTVFGFFVQQIVVGAIVVVPILSIVVPEPSFRFLLACARLCSSSNSVIETIGYAKVSSLTLSIGHGLRLIGRFLLRESFDRK
jgi:hypothetical protein